MFRSWISSSEHVLSPAHTNSVLLYEVLQLKQQGNGRPAPSHRHLWEKNQGLISLTINLDKPIDCKLDYKCIFLAKQNQPRQFAEMYGYLELWQHFDISTTMLMVSRRRVISCPCKVSMHCIHFGCHGEVGLLTTMGSSWERKYISESSGFKRKTNPWTKTSSTGLCLLSGGVCVLGSPFEPSAPLEKPPGEKGGGGEWVAWSMVLPCRAWFEGSKEVTAAWRETMSLGAGTEVRDSAWSLGSKTWNK